MLVEISNLQAERCIALERLFLEGVASGCGGSRLSIYGLQIGHVQRALFARAHQMMATRRC